MRISEALELISTLNKITQDEVIFTADARSRVLGEDIKASKSLPGFTNSAMDGYAYAWPDKDSALELVGTIYAGDFKDYELKKGQCFRIMTGAKMPKGADSVMMQELAVFENGKLKIHESAKGGENVRLRGEEFLEGSLICEKGSVLGVTDLMSLYNFGVFSLLASKRLKIGVFASGAELFEAHERKGDNAVYNCNAIGICSLFLEQDTRYLGILKDEKASVKDALEGALNHFELVITMGAASVGEADFIPEVLSELGFIRIVGGLKIKPGGPTKIYQKDNKFVLVLPGNPMAAYVASLVFGRALVARLTGAKYEPLKLRLASQKDIKLKKGRENILLCHVVDGYLIGFCEQYSSAQIAPLMQNTHYAICEDFLAANTLVDVYELVK